MKTLDFHKKSMSFFGGKVGDHPLQKQSVAKAVIEKILWRQKIDTLFINDGSSTAYVWTDYLTQWTSERPNDRLRVYTNNLDVPLQCMFLSKEANFPVEVENAPGRLNIRYFANLGEETEEWVAQHCPRGICLLAVTALDAEVGPCGRDEDARAVKRVVMQHAKRLVIVADHRKLSQPRDEIEGTAADPDVWRDWIKERKDRIWVVTDLDSSLKTKPRFTKYETPASPLQWQEENARLLRIHLGDNFLTVSA